MDKNLHKWTPGDAVTADRLDALRKAIISVMVGGENINVKESGSKIAIEYTGAPAPISPLAVSRFRVKSAQNDYLVCRTWNAAVQAEGAADILIAKPCLLRQTPFDGQTIVYPGQSITYTYTSQSERTADDGTDSETQIMTPAYFVNDEILAVYGINGGTGVEVAGNNLMWEDINSAGRFWAKEAS